MNLDMLRKTCPIHMTVRRKIFGTLALCTIVTTSLPASGEPVTVPNIYKEIPVISAADISPKIDILSQFADLLGKLGDNLSKFTDGVDKSIKTGRKIYDGQQARNARDTLVEIRKRVLVFNTTNNFQFVSAVDAYIANPSDGNWSEVQRAAKDSAETIKSLVNLLFDAGSYFPLETSFEDIFKTIQRSGYILQVELKDLPRPTTQKELDLLRVANDNYKKLMSDLDYANRALAEYIEKL